MNKSFNYSMIHKFLILSMFFCNFMVISSSTIFSMWIWMEFISLLMYSFFLLNSFFNKNIMIIFIMQSLSLILLITSILPIISLNINFSSKYLIFLLMISMSLKMGLFPFIYWYNYIIKNLSWINILIFTTTMKFIPLIMFSSILPFNMILFVLIPSSIISSFLMMNSFNLKEIISMSSVFNSSWIMFIIFINKSIGLMCFSLYSMNLWILCMLLNNFNNLMKFNFKNISNFYSFIFFSNLISMMGIPPFSGMIMKILMILSFTELKFFILSFLLIILSLLNMYSYFKFMNFILFNSSIKINFILNNYPLKISIPVMFNLSLMFFFMFI